jgi:hypothetical protein
MRYFKTERWKNGNRWYVHDVGTPWYYPIRILGITPIDFVKLLEDKYNAEVKWNRTFLLFGFEEEKDAAAFQEMINKEAKKKGVKVNV